ncbi:MAG: hypothetical protein ACT4O9_07535 [Blastocatellia bacterium]
MNVRAHFTCIPVLAVMVFASLSLAAQQPLNSEYKSQEISEIDGVPVLLKHLPDWERVRGAAVFTNRTSDLKAALGDRAVLDLIDFSGGTEAVTAPYEAGSLLIVEYTNPQGSAFADQRFLAKLAENPSTPPTVYRRIGNYNAFVFDAADEAAANALLEQIKYQKTVQWLGEDPYLARKLERYLALSASDIVVTTALFIVSVLAFALGFGLLAGFIYYRFRDQRRANQTAFSDAGGMIRLNLDELSEPLRLE